MITGPGRFWFQESGYGRNAQPFIEKSIEVTGIEISETAIDLAHRRLPGYIHQIYHGSVTEMPFDQQLYDGIFCYSLILLLDQPSRKN